MKKFTLAIACALILGFTSCSSAKSGGNEDSSKVTEKQAAAANEEAQYQLSDGWMLSVNGRPMLVDFSATWCGPCRQLKPIFAQLKNDYAGKIDFITIDVDANPELAQKYGVESIPTLVYISPAGQVKHQSVGFQDAAAIKADIATYL